MPLQHPLQRPSALASALNSALDPANASDPDRALASTLASASHLSLDLSRADLGRADLKGANLRDINLTGVDLTGADLTYADVTGTIFGDNSGLTETDKRDLKSRGAIFQDPPSSDVPALALR